MDPNDNVYAPNSTYQKIEVIAQDQGSPMHEGPTLHDFQSILIQLSCYIVFNVNITCAIDTRGATPKIYTHQNDLHADPLFQSLIIPKSITNA